MKSQNKLKRTAATRPGELLFNGLQQVRQFLGPRRGGLGQDAGSELDPAMVQYLTTVLENANSTVGMRNSRELRTLAQAIDDILVGKIDSAADILMQRFKAVEIAAADGHWKVAEHLEVIPQTKPLAAADREREAAAETAVREAKLRAILSGSRFQHDEGDGGGRGAGRRQGGRGGGNRL